MFIPTFAVIEREGKRVKTHTHTHTHVIVISFHLTDTKHTRI